MPDQNNTNTTQPTMPPVATDASVVDAPTVDAPAPIIPDELAAPAVDDVTMAPVADADASATTESDPGIIAEVATKIAEAHNILVALSSDPSVDEMSAAIGLTLFLDKIGKRVTAIYSGNTPNALEFLKPEETFEQNADILQDFVIALNKEKADHLRYKLDGDYVKIFITPYRSRIANEDLEFSYGDFNVDLVLALDVANGVDLDAALREHGRIMHDAVVVNITTGNPGKLGEIEWSDKTASSISEMIVELLYGMGAKDKIGKEEATAFLTGIVAATNRFANASTTPKTMEIASRLMESGANQQLISQNITPDIENEFFNFNSVSEKVDQDPTKLDIEHNETEITETPAESTAVESATETPAEESKQVEATITEKESTLLDDLKAAEASLATAGAEVTPEAVVEPLHIDSSEETSTPESFVMPEPTTNITPDGLPPVTADLATPGLEDSTLNPEKIITPPEDFAAESFTEGTNKYGQMLEDALAESDAAPAMPANPAASIAPPVAAEPEINGVPEINYMPMPGDEVLPPPPAPPVDFSNVTVPTPEVATAPDAAAPDVIVPPMPEPEPAPTPLGPQPAMQDQVYTPQASNPGAFKIPGM